MRNTVAAPGLEPGDVNWRQTSSQHWVKQVAIVVGATLFIAVCARITIPLPFTPVPLTVQDFGVLMVGMVLGSRLGFAALVLYLLEGVSGLPVFNPLGPGGLAQLFGPTGGFLMAYPFVAALAGWIAEHGARTFSRLVVSGIAAVTLLFAGGISWLAFLTHSLAQAFRLGFYWFVFAELIKIMMAAAIVSRWRRSGRAAA